MIAGEKPVYGEHFLDLSLFQARFWSSMDQLDKQDVRIPYLGFEYVFTKSAFERITHTPKVGPHRYNLGHQCKCLPDEAILGHEIVIGTNTLMFPKSWTRF